jgi:hypothetical protein
MARAAAAAAAPATTAGRAAPAPARRAPAKRQPARRQAAPAKRRTRRASGAAAPRRARRAAPRKVALPLGARMLDALLNGRIWIGLVGVLLAGIVFFNVDLLQMNREIARNDEKISAMRREIARNRLDVARLASSKRIQESAGQLGLVQPAPGEVRYLKARPRLDARQAAKRITAPNLAYVPPPPIDTAPEPVVPDPAAATDPAATDPAATDPAATDPAAADPAAADPAAVPAPATTATPAG